MITKKYITLLLLPFIMSVVGCNKLEDFGDTNVNPSGTNAPILGALLTNVQAGIGGYAAQTRGGLYSQYFSETQYSDASLYSIPQINFAGEYSGSLMDLQNIRNVNSSKNMSAVAKILQQYIFWTLTDRFGSLPYTQALKGNATPAFDTQETIYKAILSNLKSAVEEFDNTSLITGDIINGGDVAKWKLFANSLRLLVSIRLSEVYPAADGYAALEFKNALAHTAGIIDANSKNFVIAYPGGTFKNPWFSVYDGRKDYAVSATMMKQLSDFGDTRVTAFAGASEVAGTTSTSTIGVPYGVKRATAEAFTSANPTWARILRGDLRNDNSTLVVLGASHVFLARAHAAELGWTAESIATMFENGVKASFQQWGVTAPASSYFSTTGVIIGTKGTNLKAIAIQRWIAAYPDGLQGWGIWRETGFPVLTPAPDALVAGTLIPRRYTFGQNEYATNPVNTKAAATAMGGDLQDTKLWWDK